MTWYQILNTIYLVGFLISFIVNWVCLELGDENPREEFILIIIFSLGWVYFVPLLVKDFKVREWCWEILGEYQREKEVEFEKKKKKAKE